MVNNMKITVLTTTYNRGRMLNKIYTSLVNQTDKDFQWLIIDDGSQDNTQEIVNEFLNSKNEFQINYYWKNNGGKHTALNYAHEYITGDIVVIVDSDDILVQNGISLIKNAWREIYQDSNYGTVVFEQVDSNGEKLGEFPDSYYNGSDLDYRIKKGIKGDFSETIRTEVLKEFPFPSFKSPEKFFSEGWLWTKVAMKYKTINLKKNLVIGGYQEGGLTKSGRKMRFRSPVGLMMYYKQMKSLRQLPLITRLKSTMAFNVYKILNKNDVHTLTNAEIQQMFGKMTILEMLLYPPAQIFYYYYKIKMR